MNVNREQVEAMTKIIKQNPSIVRCGIGFYSSGDMVMKIYWDFDPTKKIYNINIDKDGKY